MVRCCLTFIVVLARLSSVLIGGFLLLSLVFLVLSCFLFFLVFLRFLDLGRSETTIAVVARGYSEPASAGCRSGGGKRSGAGCKAVEGTRRFLYFLSLRVAAWSDIITNPGGGSQSLGERRQRDNDGRLVSRIPVPCRMVASCGCFRVV